jgi:WD40 repeat protein
MAAFLPRQLFTAAAVLLVTAGAGRGPAGDEAPSAAKISGPLPPGAVRRLDVSRRPSDAVLALALSPDGKTVAAAGEGGAIRLYDLGPGTLLRQCDGHDQAVLAVAFAPDGRTLASGGAGATLRVWDVASAKERWHRSAHEFEVTAVAFAPDGKTLASGGGDKTVQLWDAATGNERRRFAGASRPIRCLAFSPDGQTLAAGSWDRKIYLWSVPDGKRVHTLSGHKSCVLCLTFVDAQTLVSGGRDQTVMAWDLWNGKPYLRLAGWSGEIQAVAYSRRHRALASGDANGAVRLWDLIAGRELGKPKGHPAAVQALGLSADGERLVSASSDGTVLVWDRSRLVPSPPAPPRPRLTTKELSDLWEALAGDDDDPDVYRTIHTFVAVPDQAVRFLQAKLHPVSPKDTERVAALIRTLDDDQFTEREKASEELLDRGPVAVPLLRRTLKKPLPTLEVRRRIERVLEKLPTGTLALWRTREQRAVHTLERIGTPAAKALLERLACGSADAPLTRDAREALGRLSRPAHREPQGKNASIFPWDGVP